MERAPLPFESRWQKEWSTNLRTAEELFSEGIIAAGVVAVTDRALKKFKFSLPRYYASLIDRADPRCPIRLQAIPSIEELEERPDLSPDPLEDGRHKPAPRVTHRYRNRALLHLTPNCSMYCRYCFRKSLLNEGVDELFSGDCTDALAYFASHPEIEEVILSGGDPLLAGDGPLARLVEALAALPSVKRLRIHSRVPVTFPSRITADLSRALTSSRLPLVVVAHFNHPREVTTQALAACSMLKEAGAHLLNQSVLLNGVNVDAGVLAELSERLFEGGILPYYLHHPDRAAGTGHFDVSRREGLRIHHELRSRLSGYLVPRYVVDEVGFPYKKDVTASSV